MAGKVIVEDGLSIVQNRGVGQYTLGIIKMLEALGYNVIAPRKYLLEKIENSILRRVLYFLWLNTFFVVKLLFSKNVKSVIFTSTIVPFIRVKNIEYISVLHDILSIKYPEYRTKIQNFHANLATFTAKYFANKIITVSEFSKNEIISNCKINPDKIYIVYSSFSTNLSPESSDSNILKKIGVDNKKYTLSVATLYKHKNTQVLINAFSKISDKYPDIKLVLSGSIKGNCNLQINSKNIIFTGFVSNEDLCNLYKNALIYIFPSLYEGFGTPNIDAQRFGVPVICSDIPVFHETCGNSVYYCKPDEQGFADAICNLLNKPDLQKELIQKGNENYKHYSLENIKNQLKEVLC